MRTANRSSIELGFLAPASFIRVVSLTDDGLASLLRLVYRDRVDINVHGVIAVRKADGR